MKAFSDFESNNADFESKQRTRQFTTFFQDNNRGSCITYKLLLHYFFSQNSCKVFSKPEILQSFFDQKTFCVKYSWNRVFVSLPKKTIEIWNTTTLLFSSTLTCNFDKFFPSCEFVNNLMEKNLSKFQKFYSPFFNTIRGRCITYELILHDFPRFLIKLFFRTWNFTVFVQKQKIN